MKVGSQVYWFFGERNVLGHLILGDVVEGNQAGIDIHVLVSVRVLKHVSDHPTIELAAELDLIVGIFPFITYLRRGEWLREGTERKLEAADSY